MVDPKAFMPTKIVMPGKRLEVKPQPNVHLKVEPGHLLFSKGDPGGDLYFIEKGTVDIFITQKDQEIVLTEMGVGEVIGVMTLLTLEPRLASCRAKDLVVVKKISKAAIANLIAVLPKWLHIVLKEFTARIVEMNRLYSETMVELKKSRESQITPLFIATQFVPTASLLAVGLKEGSNSILVADLLAQLMLALNQPKEVINNIWKVFVTTGCVKMTVDTAKKQPLVAIEELVGLAGFTDFLKDSVTGPNRKILRAKFTSTELKLLSTMAEISLLKGKGSSLTIVNSVPDLLAELAKQNSVVWDIGTIARAVKAGLLTTKGSGDDMTISYSPTALSTTIAYLSAIKKLTGGVDQASNPDAANLEDTEPQAAEPPPDLVTVSSELPTAGSTPAA